MDIIATELNSKYPRWVFYCTQMGGVIKRVDPGEQAPEGSQWLTYGDLPQGITMTLGLRRLLGGIG